MANFAYSPMFPKTADTTEYELISSNHVRLVEMNDETFLRVDPEALTLLAERAFADISHLLRSSHLNQLANILKDPEATNTKQEEIKIEIEETPQDMEKSIGDE